MPWKKAECGVKVGRRLQLVRRSPTPRRRRPPQAVRLHPRRCARAPVAPSQKARCSRRLPHPVHVRVAPACAAHPHAVPQSEPAAAAPALRHHHSGAPPSPRTPATTLAVAMCSVAGCSTRPARRSCRITCAPDLPACPAAPPPCTGGSLPGAHASRAPSLSMTRALPG